MGPSKIDEAYKSLLATGLFEDVRIQNAGGRIVVRVIENPVINRIAFEGNTRVKDEQLKLEIQSRERGTLSRPVVQSDVQRIVEVYRRSGRYDIRVDPRSSTCPTTASISCSRSTRARAPTSGSIEFVGNRAYSGYRLKDVIKTAETGLLSFLQSNNIYDPDRIEADRELLRRFYLKHGYIDVRIMAPTVEFDPVRAAS